MKPTVDIVSLANSTVFNADGEKIRLGTVWQKQTAILVFLRHFACIACRAHAKQVWEQRANYEKNGAKLVFVGNGAPHFIAKFKEEIGIHAATVITDPLLESFRAAGFRRGFMVVVQPQSAINMIRLAAAGHRQSMPSSEAGTNWQLGGVLAITKDGSVVYHFISQSVGDFQPDSDVEKIHSVGSQKTG